MPTDADGSITCFLDLLQAGDQSAAGQLWQRFFPRLVGLAQKTLADRPQRVADAEDAALSAFASFWKRAGRGDFKGEMDRNQLWDLLGLITVRKALKQAGRENTLKRGGGRVFGESSVLGGPAEQSGGFALDRALAQLPTQEFDLHCEEMLLSLDEDLRAIAILRLMGYSTAEIADILECTRRKVQRKLSLIGRKWQQETG